MIHRDIKSANVLLDAHQHAKVTDFGISTRFALDHTAETGTYRYMAPEVSTDPNPTPYTLHPTLSNLNPKRKPYTHSCHPP